MITPRDREQAWMMRRRRMCGWPGPMGRCFGGFNPFKLVAVVAGVVIGGVAAVALFTLIAIVLTVIGVATAGLSWLLAYGWIIAALLIYRAIRRRQAPVDAAREHQGAWQIADSEQEREYRERVRQLRQHATPEYGRPRGRSRGSAGTVALAVLSGFGLALGANVILGGLSLPPLANTVLPPLTGAVAGVGVYAAIRRWVLPPDDGETPPAKEIRAQIGRIRRKARDLRREANAAGGVFNGLDTKADLLAAEASELADRLFELRRVAKDARGRAHAAADGDGPGGRVHELLRRNRAAQQQCLTQIGRIESLLDVARLEIACPDEAMPADRGREELMQEVETELEAARRALLEVQRESQIL